MQDALDENTVQGIMGRIRFIFRMTVILELLGALLLWLRWQSYPQYGLGRSLYLAVFHSISAFCNAGFSLFSTSLEGFADDWVVNATVIMLIVIGGFGFVVIQDVVNLLRKRRAAGQARYLRLQSRVVLRVSLALILVGAVFFFIAERGHSLENLTPAQKFARSLFQSVTARTAGFNTIRIGALTHAALFAIILLMFVGASPGSTGGGIKTTTVWTVVRYGLASLRGRRKVQSDQREVPLALVQKAAGVLVIALFVLGSGTFGLLMVETKPFHHLLFEATSAFGTVGLSCGITPKLSVPGKLIVTVLMFAGRLGPLTIAMGLVRRPRTVRIGYPEERLMIG